MQVLVAEYIFEEFARISVEVEYASEFRYNPIINSKDGVPYPNLVKQLIRWPLLSWLKKKVLSYLECVTSLVLLSQETHAGAYTHAGPESGILKAFTTQITVLTMIALRLAKPRDPFTSVFICICKLELIPERLRKP
jgi:glucosamine--fructose-6-phosphate aminotransferase (isomerizing)